MRLLTLLINIFIIVGTASAHPLHLSITNIDMEADTAKISIRVFDNGLFLHLAQCYPDSSSFEQADSSVLKQRFVINYIEKTFRLIVNDKAAKLDYKNKREEEGSVWYCFSAKIPTEIEKCTIENRILTECYGDQKNLTVIKKGEFESGLEFDSFNTRIEVKLN